MSTINKTTLYNMGCRHGAADLNRAGTQRTLVVFHYGVTYYNATKGTYMSSAYGGADATMSQVASALKSYGQGYFYCTESDIYSNIVVAYGTSNDAQKSTEQTGQGGHVTYGAGQAMAAAVGSMASYYASIDQVVAAAGNDIELDWSSPTAARNWVNGYDSQNTDLLYTFGDAAGCADNHYGDECGGRSFPSWTVADVWYVNFGATPAVPLPQIYREDGKNARQWRWIGVYSYEVQNKKMLFRGPMTQYGACTQVGGCGSPYYIANTPTQGYNQLYTELNRDSRTSQTPAFLTDIRWYQA